MFDPTRVKAVFFDLDGTLIDTDNVAVARLARRARILFGRRSLRISRWIFMRLETPGNAVITVLDWLHLDVPVMRFRHWLRERLSGSDMHFELVPGVLEMMREVSRRFPIALVTTRSRVSIDAFLTQYPEINEMVEISSGMEDTRRIKPHPEPVERVASLLEIPVDACVMVGDTAMDVLAGKRAGAQAVAVLCGFGERRELARAGADLILESTADFAWWLRESPNT